MKARQVVDLRNNTDIVFERKNLPDTHPVDRLRIGMNDANRTVVYTRVGIRGAFGQIDIVVNNAGATKRGDFLELTDEDWADGFALKFFGAMRLTRAA